MLRNPTVRTLGGRAYIVGTEWGTARHPGAFPGQVVWIPVDEARLIAEIADLKKWPGDVP